MSPANDPVPPRPSPDAPATLKGPVRWLFMAAAWVFLLLGLAGIVVPGMPTTVFILLAAWAAARSSPRLHAWLLGHRLFGPMLRDWRDGGYVSRRAKWSASAAMALCALILLWVASRPGAAWWPEVLAITCMTTVLAWLWLRPERR